MHTKILSLLLVVCWAFPLPAAAELSFATANRTDNSQKLKPVVNTEDTTEIRVNLLDCRENIDVNFHISEEDAVDGSLYLVVGKDCTDKSTEEGDDKCDFIDEITPNGDFGKKLRTLLNIEGIEDADQCDGEGSTTIWAARISDISDRGDAAEEDWSDPITLKWDMDPPGVPEGLSSAPGDKKVEVRWNADNGVDAGTSTVGLDDDVNEVRVVYMESADGVGDAGAAGIDSATSEQDTSALLECPTGGFQAGDEYVNDAYDEKLTDMPTGGKLTVSGLTNGHAYKFAAVAIDEYKNPSEISETVCGMPGDTRSFFDDYKDAGGNGGKFCFVATAAFGSYDHPTVQLLRRFRDQFVAPMPFGQVVIDGYYRVGPVFATVVTTHPILQSTVKGALFLFALGTVPFSALGPLYSLLLGLAMVMGIVIYKRR